jgi:hypothetical protein
MEDISNLYEVTKNYLMKLPISQRAEFVSNLFEEIKTISEDEVKKQEGELNINKNSLLKFKKEK